VLAKRKRLLGAEHPDTLRSKTALACTLVALNEQEGARVLFDKVLAAQLRRLGPDHPDTRKTMELLGVEQPRPYEWRRDARPGGAPDAEAGEFAPVRELHQDAAMADYDNALPRPPLGRVAKDAAGLRARRGDELLALDEQLGGARPASR
jgi:hypothetical protein